jgi:hypothetical protein
VRTVFPSSSWDGYQ